MTLYILRHKTYVSQFLSFLMKEKSTNIILEAPFALIYFLSPTELKKLLAFLIECSLSICRFKTMVFSCFKFTMFTSHEIFIRFLFFILSKK